MIRSAKRLPILPQGWRRDEWRIPLVVIVICLIAAFLNLALSWPQPARVVRDVVVSTLFCGFGIYGIATLIRLPAPSEHGTTHIELEPLDLMARLAALVPLPHSKLRTAGWAGARRPLTWIASGRSCVVSRRLKVLSAVQGDSVHAALT